MTTTWQLISVTGVLALVVSAASKRMKRWPVSPPLLALLLGVLVGPDVLGLLDVASEVRSSVLLEVARFLLVTSLISTALRYRASQERARVVPVAVLLVTMMVGMTAVSALLGWWLLGIPVALAVLLGAALSPTDPVLASSVVTGDLAKRALPGRLRQILSLESGANDGLALPLVILGLAAVEGHALGGAAVEGLVSVTAAAAIGGAVGAASGWALRTAARDRDITSALFVVYSVLVALTVLAVSRLVGVDGILGAFVAGLVYDRFITESARETEQDLDEGLENVLVLPLFVLFGAWLPWSQWADLGWGGVAFAVAVLLLRRPPLVVGLRGLVPTRLALPDAVWLGWFGPVGVATIFYLSHSEHEGVTDPTLWAAGSLVVALSTVVFGITAAPGARAYARATHDDHDDESSQV